MRCRDVKGKEMYLDIPLTREALDPLIKTRVFEAIDAARQAIIKAGLTAKNIERIVFVGGPTQYKPLRDLVCRELAVPGSGEVDPMTAVATGASVFAESIDWTTEAHSKRSSRGRMSSEGSTAIVFDFVARTPDKQARIVARLGGQTCNGFDFQVDSLDTGWSSGRKPLINGAIIEVPLSKPNENDFKIFVFDGQGGPVELSPNRVVITRTLASVDAIPASHSIGIEVLDRLGGRPVLDWLVRSGDPLPKKGKRTFRAGESLKAGEPKALHFRLWEGEIEEPISDNRPVGELKISGADFPDGTITPGAALECQYEMTDSGNIRLQVDVPSIGSTFGEGHNFYSRQEGQLDFASASARVQNDGQATLARIDKIDSAVDDPRLDEVRSTLSKAISESEGKPDPETVQESRERVLAAKRVLAAVRKDHLKSIRSLDLDRIVSFFNNHVRPHARTSESDSFDNLVITARRSIERGDSDFEFHLEAMRGKNFEILWRQDWFLVDRFKDMASEPEAFPDQVKFRELVTAGQAAVKSDNIDRLRQVVGALFQLRIATDGDDDFVHPTNILRG